jgi:peptidoglycan/xylan/chitin deacetylase (PgdA/CDA1 family)
MSPIPVLCYHAVTDEPSRWIAPLAVTPMQFAAHLMALRAAACTVLTIPELISIQQGAAPLPAHPVALTFDDGFAGVYTHAAPLLAAAGMPASVYVTTGVVGARSPGGDLMLTWDQILTLAAHGTEIGGHTHLHHELDAVPVAVARSDIGECKQRLEDHLGSLVTGFAHPHGYSNATVRRLVRETGFDHAFAVRNAVSSSRDDRFAISRLTVTSTTGAQTVGAWVGGHDLPASPWPRPVLVAGWRMFRRSTHALGRGGAWEPPPAGRPGALDRPVRV